jgi:hypothetical protein
MVCDRLQRQRSNEERNLSRMEALAGLQRALRIHGEEMINERQMGFGIDLDDARRAADRYYRTLPPELRNRLDDDGVSWVGSSFELGDLYTGQAKALDDYLTDLEHSWLPRRQLLRLRADASWMLPRSGTAQ